ncbi:MAG: hypothetical protein K9L60_14375 [Methylovulum sp.]|jgi:hypothetical protein|nr:hypothetical protein [Methylovulum sp.]MCF8000148.1 hypothetical protein [Methylovulum sp.]
MICAQKAKVALAAVKGSKTVNEIAQEYGVHPMQVGLYEEGIIGCASQLVDVTRSIKTIDPQNDPEWLYAKIGRLNMALEWRKPTRGTRKKSEISL